MLGVAGVSLIAPNLSLSRSGPVSKATTLPAGASLPSDATAASRVRRPPWEPRPENARANRTVPTRDELRRFFAANGSWGRCGDRLKARVTGNFRGTTDEIVQWASWKWGINEDVLRAVAERESDWRQDKLGDYEGSVPHSYGLTQVRRNAEGQRAPAWNGTYPLSARSTAFNVDYWGAKVRYYYEGCAGWLNHVERGRPYVAGDLWGSIGAWYAGRWQTPAARDYIREVRDILGRRDWARG